eukprot:198921-Chlamydomonas_euryale.AAC.4
MNLKRVCGPPAGRRQYYLARQLACSPRSLDRAHSSTDGAMHLYPRRARQTSLPLHPYPAFHRPPLHSCASQHRRRHVSVPFCRRERAAAGRVPPPLQPARVGRPAARAHFARVSAGTLLRPPLC